MNSETIKVDIVYTWVDGADVQFLESSKEYTDFVVDINPERFRDIYEMLKYSLRSLEMYVPWINNVFIVTQRPQIPDWLDESHSKIRIVHHDEFYENEGHLPTFNCLSIESYLHRIPGLSEYFIYLNDDFLFGNHTSLDMFYSKEGVISVFGTVVGENLPFRIYDKKNDIFGLGLVEHSPLFIKKEFWRSMMALFPEEIEKTRQEKFRKGYHIRPPKLYKYYMLKYQSKISRAIWLWELRKFHVFNKITNNQKKQNVKLKRIETMKPNFYCLNDDQKDDANPNVVRLVQDFLRTNYPNPSSFEKKKEC